MTENIEHYRSQISLARTEIKNLRQKLSALKNEHLKEIKYIRDVLDGLKCSNCASQATTVVNQNNSNDLQVPMVDECIKFKPIGYIHTVFESKRGVPRQPQLLTESKGTVVIDLTVFSNPEHALDGLQEFSHMWLLYHFHKTDGVRTPAKVTPPRLGERRGVLSTRSPHRPCPIGMSLVKIHSIEGNKIHFHGIDMVDGTPLLDLKPYIPQYDCPQLGDAAPRPPTEGDPSSPDEDYGPARFTPPQANLSLNQDGVRIAPWIANPPAQRYHVTFDEDARERLHELIGARAEPFKTNIECLLSEDPRSLYVRTRYPHHEYSCVLEDISISCVFDASLGICTIVAVHSAEELQDN